MFRPSSLGLHQVVRRMYVFHILYPVLYSFLDKDLRPDDDQMKSAETCSQISSYIL